MADYTEDLVETVPLTESLTGIYDPGTLSLDIDETLDVFDDTSTIQVGGQEVDETLTITDVIDIGPPVVPAETVAIAEGFLLSYDAEAGPSETVLISDQVDFQYDSRADAGEDVILVVDNAQPSVGIASSVSETVALADSLQTSQFHLLQESLTVSEALTTRSVGKSKVVETVTVFEAVSAVRSANRLLVGEVVFVAEQAKAPAGRKSRVMETITVSESLFVSVRIHTSKAETVSVGENLSHKRTSRALVRDRVPLIDVVSIDGSLAAAAIDENTVQLFFGAQVPLSAKMLSPSSYALFPLDGGVPITVSSVTPVQELLQTGIAGKVLPYDDGTSFSLRAIEQSRSESPGGRRIEEGYRFQFPWVIPPSVGNYMDITGSRYSFTGLRVMSVDSLSTSVIFDRRVVTTDPNNGNMTWVMNRAPTSILLEVHGATKGKSYLLRQMGIMTSAGAVLDTPITFIANSVSPTVDSYETDSDTGAITVTFSEALEINQRLLDPSLYAISGPSAVRVVAVALKSDRQVIVYPTPTFVTGTYNLVLPSLTDISLNRVGS